MGKKKEKENLAEELAKSFERWEYLKENGCSVRWSSFFVTLTRKSFDIHHTCILFSNGVIYPFDECGRI